MRKVMMITAAALLMGASGALAAPRTGGFAHGPSGFSGGTRGGAAVASPQMSVKGTAGVTSNFAGNNLGARNNFVASGPNHTWSGHGHGYYAYNGHRHRPDWDDRGWGGGYGLYAYEPGYDSCYDYGYGYAPYYNGYYNNCAYDYYEPGPGISFGWGW